MIYARFAKNMAESSQLIISLSLKKDSQALAAQHPIFTFIKSKDAVVKVH